MWQGKAYACIWYNAIIYTDTHRQHYRAGLDVVDSTHKYKLMDWTHDKPYIEIQLTEGLIK